ncbi:FZD1_7 [Mytilus coruscus]|uniref:FZD1_7 n=1 Tax=Mytilus coruscus TaxID=42192 RepID=A0A6J8A8G2_MYTCO|nr:FZD1_7 [Mytilus coruscus]
MMLSKLTAFHFWTVLVVFVTTYKMNINAQQHNRCEPIVIPLCKDVPYNETIMPNLLSHQSQVVAGSEIKQFSPFLDAKCSPHLRLFVCLMYVPVCTVLEEAIQPCRSVCEKAQNGCKNLMDKEGFNWPVAFNCDNFSPNGLCAGYHNIDLKERSQPIFHRKTLESHPGFYKIRPTIGLQQPPTSTTAKNFNIPEGS